MNRYIKVDDIIIIKGIAHMVKEVKPGTTIVESANRGRQLMYSNQNLFEYLPNYREMYEEEVEARLTAQCELYELQQKYNKRDREASTYYANAAEMTERYDDIMDQHSILVDYIEDGTGAVTFAALRRFLKTLGGQT